MNTLRQKTDAEQAVADYIGQVWRLVGKRDHDANTVEVIEQLAADITALARSNPMVVNFLRERTKRLKLK